MEMVEPSKELIVRAKEGKRKLMERDAKRPKRKAQSVEEDDEREGPDNINS
jgi:hypothetical protein